MLRGSFFFVLLLGLAACGSDGSSDDDDAAVTFEFLHGIEEGAPTYRATTTDTALIAEARAELAKPLASRTKHLNGIIATGSGDDNVPWNWHFVEDEWALAEISTEVCDADPTFVADDPEGWIATVGRYCPWSALVSREVEP